MASFKIIIFSLICLLCSTNYIHGYFSAEEKTQIYFLMHKNDVVEALEKYKALSQKNHAHDFEALQQMSYILLSQGIDNSEAEMRQASLFGAGLAGSSKSLNILQKGLTTQDPYTQLIALHFIKNNFDTRSDDLLLRSMHSDFLMTRLEAALILAQRKHYRAAGQIEALMHKLPVDYKPFFPSLFAALSTPESNRMIKKMLYDESLYVRIESILATAHTQQDELVANIRTKLAHSNIAELEASVYALGLLHDNLSFEKIKSLLSASAVNVRVAAAKALYNLGDRRGKEFLLNLAKEKNLLAISMLGEIPGSEDILASLLDEDLSIRVNAAASLLRLKDPRCVPVLIEILLSDERDIALQPNFSLGRTILYWKLVTSSSQRKNDRLFDPNLSIHIKNHFLKQTIDLQEKYFLKIADTVFTYNQNELVPTLITLLENSQSVNSIKILKKFTNKLGSPLIRDYCNLALFRLKEEGDYEARITKWIEEKKDFPLIRLRPLVPFLIRFKDTNYQLTAEETSQLLIETYLAVASRQNEKMITLLIDAIQTGKIMNRYVLAGLLLKATE